MDLTSYIETFLPLKHKETELNECCKDNEIIDEGKIFCNVCGRDLGVHLVCNTNGKITDRHNSNIERVGAPINTQLPESSMGTSIRWSRNPEMARMRRYQNWSVMPSKERSLYHVYTFIANYCNNDTVSISKKAQTTAKTLYQIISERYTTRGAKRKGLIAACVYYACKYENVPKDPAIIAELFQIRNRDISTGMRIFQSISSGIDHPLLHFNEETTVPKDYLGRYCTLLGITDTKMFNIAQAICQKIETIDDMEFYTPTTIAASVMFYILQSVPSSPPIGKLADILNISSGTILKCYRDIVENEEKILPPKLVAAFRSQRK